MKKGVKSKPTPGVKGLTNLLDVSKPTDRKELFWLKGKRDEETVYRVPTKFLFFNIENGRYADKMIQLKEDNPGIDIDPKENKWKKEIQRMLMGEYPGTEKDKEPFQKLRTDIVARLQLRPGVVLSDGGVLDGNRRLAVLLNLASTEKNPTRFEFFDAVILPSDVGLEDRWRIEAGLQLGREEQLAYSTVNQLLKIKEGLELFKASKNPEAEIAKTLWGVDEKEVRKDIEKVKLIDAYLLFINRPKAYNEITKRELNERFEEAVTILETAKKQSLPATKVQAIRMALFAAIRDKTMDNWELREINKALKGSGKATPGAVKKAKALDAFLEPTHTFSELRKALSSKGSESPLFKTSLRKAEEFMVQVEAANLIGKPISLATDAKTKLEALRESLNNTEIVKYDGWHDIQTTLPDLLKSVINTARDCSVKTQKLRSLRSATASKKKR